jgi:branched-chain amino acid transport system substrate-binding protein
VLCLLCLAGCALPGTTRPVLKLGLVAPFEGWYRLRGYDALWGVRLAIQEVNDRGGSAGHLVELVVLDDHLDPRWAVQRAQELVADPAVMGVVGCLSPSTASAARGVYSAAALPLVTSASVEANGDGMFVLAPAPDALAQTATDYIAAFGPSLRPRDQGAGPRRAQSSLRVVLLYGEGGDTWATALWGKASVQALVELDSPGWLEDLLEARPDWVICTAGARVAGEVLEQARGEGLRASFVGGPEWGTEASRKVAGDAVWGTWFVTGAPREGNLEEADAFLLAYRDLGNHEPGPDAVLTYDATRTLLAALAEAIEDRGYPTREGVRAALGEVSLRGVTGPIRFDRRGARREAPIWVYPH